MCHRICLVSLFVGCLTTTLSAQQFSTVQLPTYQRFSMGTAVLVPDQGRAYVGGMNRSSRTSSRFGNSSGVSAGGVTVTAFVHDLEAMDAAVLEQGRLARLRRGQSHLSSVSRSPAPAPIHVGSRFSRVSDIRRQTAETDQRLRRRAQSDFELAQRLLKKGKIELARTMLKTAANRADSKLQALIDEQLAELDGVDPVVVANSPAEAR